MQTQNILKRGGLGLFRDEHAEHSTTEYFINKVNQ
jgi:hypothetical protein